MAVNLRGTFLVGREALRVMAGQGAGRVINIASELAYLGRANFSVYCASKGAVVSMTRSWAREFAPDILVNAIAPGPTDTPMLGPEYDRRRRCARPKRTSRSAASAGRRRSPPPPCSSPAPAQPS